MWPLESIPPIGTLEAYSPKVGSIYDLVNQDHYTLNANLFCAGMLKGRCFYTDEGGVIRAKSDGPAAPADEIVK